MKLSIAILGPTASGKSDFAVELAKVIGGQIVCLDSTTVYRGFDIGTAKPSQEAQKTVAHHLLDIADPDDPMTAFQFMEQADSVLSKIHAQGAIPVVVGGTHFYFKALQYGMYPTQLVPNEVVEQVEQEYFEEEQLNSQRMHEDLKKKDPKAAQKIHPNDQYRLTRAHAIIRHCNKLPSSLKPEPISEAQKERHWLKYAMCVARHKLSTNIVARTVNMIAQGFVEETKALREKYPNATALKSVGYRECCRFLDGEIDEKQMKNEIIEKTRQLAKRQMCWVRSDEQLRIVDQRDLARVKLEVDNLLFAMENAS